MQQTESHMNNIQLSDKEKVLLLFGISSLINLFAFLFLPGREVVIYVSTIAFQGLSQMQFRSLEHIITSSNPKRNRILRYITNVLLENKGVKEPHESLLYTAEIVTFIYIFSYLYDWIGLNLLTFGCITFDNEKYFRSFFLINGEFLRLCNSR